ncbi:MAG: hypothetical protein AB1330_01645 [Bacillota bacterium]
MVRLLPSEIRLLEWLDKNVKPGEPVSLDIEAVSTELGLAIATLYRSIHALANAGLLTISPGAVGSRRASRVIYYWGKQGEAVSLAELDKQIDGTIEPMHRLLKMMRAIIERQAREIQDWRSRYTALETEYKACKKQYERFCSLLGEINELKELINKDGGTS